MKWATGFDRFRPRGKDGALKEFLLLSIGHNIKQIARHLGSTGPNDKNRLPVATAMSLFNAMNEILAAYLKKSMLRIRQLTISGPITVIA